MWNNFFNLLKNSKESILKIIDKKRESAVKIFPPRELIFHAFSFFPPEKTKVVILGQDCYHGEGEAIGLAFAVPSDVRTPPSLRNIQKEVLNDVGTEPKKHLENWAKQGVLLLNCALTVKAHKPGSHIKIWEPFTDELISLLSKRYKNIVFMLWGKFAQKKEKLICPKGGHLILKASHPSPLSVWRGGWFGNKHFSKSNNFLAKKNKKEIIW